VAGEIRAGRVVVEGDATADVYARDLVEIGATGSLFGNLVSPRLVIHEGAVFEGRSALADPGRAEDAASVAQTEVVRRDEAVLLAS